MKGRIPTPTAIRMAEGNPGKRRLNKSESIGQAKALYCPRDLRIRGRRLWWVLVKELKKMGVLRPADRLALSILCMFYEFMLDARDEIWKLPSAERYVVRSRRGGLRLHPLFQIFRDSAAEVVGLAAQFGLSPVSRARLRLDFEEGISFADVDKLLSGWPSGGTPRLLRSFFYSIPQPEIGRLLL
jgi:P27 family predicted phage terminase small subunit